MFLCWCKTGLLLLIVSSSGLVLKSILGTVSFQTVDVNKFAQCLSDSWWSVSSLCSLLTAVNHFVPTSEQLPIITLLQCSHIWLQLGLTSIFYTCLFRTYHVGTRQVDNCITLEVSKCTFAIKIHPEAQLYILVNIYFVAHPFEPTTAIKRFL